MGNRPRVLLADDHTLFLEALKRLLAPECDVVGAVSDGRSLLESAPRLKPDVVVVDIAMPQLNGLDACERLLRMVPGTKLIVLTASEDPDVAGEALRRGASGFLLKKCAAAELFAAIQQVLRGRHFVTSLITAAEPASVYLARVRSGRGGVTLSLRQREVLQLLAEGRSMKEAGSMLNVTPRTVAFHKYSIMQLLGIRTSAELARYAAAQGLVAGRPEAPETPPRLNH